MMTPKLKQPANLDTSETAMRRVGDIELRLRGFKIHARPQRGSVIWERNGVTVMEPAAIDIARRELQGPT